jgi:hypothetical protein
MLLQVSCALLLIYIIGCFLELKLHVLLLSSLYSGLQSIHIWFQLCKNGACLFYVIQENLRIWYYLFVYFVLRYM